MGMLSNRQVLVALIALTGVAVGVTALMASTAHHGMEPIHYAPAGAMVLVTVAWPFATGWRPFGSASSLAECSRCGTQWRPVDEGTSACPACDAGF